MRAYERFIEYVKIDTTSNEASGTHPSYEGEFDLARVLVNELEKLGLVDIRLDEKCYVYGCLPATQGCKAKALGLIAHMDTADDASGTGVSPVLHPDYDGNDIIMEKEGRVISTDKFPFLKKFIGETVITSDGSTLLGADDKAGVAEIITAIEIIKAEGISHGDIWVAFTPDEEIGEGADNFDLEYFKADYAYTVDGGDIDAIEYENFNAASAHIEVRGLSVHPGDAKDKMINANNVAMEFHELLPARERPEHTEGHEGFYHLMNMNGNVSSATLDYLIRDHDSEAFEAKKATMIKNAKIINEKYNDSIISLEIRDSYYNMLEKIKPNMFMVDFMKNSITNAGLVPRIVPIRGGTDGARLSYMGLPCPNLGTGGYNFHGEYELISVERMDKAVEIIVDIVKQFSKLN